MLRTLTLAYACLLAAVILGQVQIGQNEMPHAGDALNRTRANTNPFVNYAATGPAHTWNFANLTAASEDLTPYQSVASTNFVYALAYADIFFNANHAKAGVDIPFNELLPIDNPFTFLYRSASVYRKVGFGVELAGIPVPIIFNSPDVVYELPLDYGDASVSNSAYQISIPALAHYGYQQQRTNEVDGWGAITTPAGTFDVLRVKTTLQGRDTINIDTLGLGFTIDRPTIHEYKWLAPGLRVPVLQINTTELFGAQIVTEIFYYDQPHTISVVQPLAATLCPGSEVTVPYEATGSYNAGSFLVPSNEFIAQLSDVNGSFANPTFLGEVTTTSSGTITVTIPAGTLPGTGYRIRVNSNSPAYIGADNGFDITIDGTAPTAAISADGPTEFCGGGSVTLSAAPVSGTYQWLLNGTDIDGAEGPSLLATAAGDYTLVVSNACGTDVSDAITVSTAAEPAYAFDQSAYLSCDGSPLTIIAIDNSGQSDLNYEWYLNDVVLSGEDGSSLVAAEAGGYSLVVTNTVTGCSYSADAVPVAIDQVGTPVVEADGPTAFCAGGSVSLNVVEVAGVDYQWSLDGMVINGAIGTSLLVEEAGSYTVAGTSSGCSSASSEAVEVSIELLPATPVITALEGVAFCTGGGTTLDAGNDPGLAFAWSVDGNTIDGADASQLLVAAPGDYTVTVSSDAGCSTSSAAITIMENPLPDQPVITQSGDLLSTSGTGTFQWLLNGTVIDGATDQSYSPTENGNYNVTITDPNGCSSTSDAFVFISTGIATGDVGTFSLCPNPTHGLVFLQLPALAHTARLSVMDATGRTVLDRSVSGGNTTLDLSDQQAGLYFVRLLNGSVPTILRLVVN